MEVYLVVFDHKAFKISSSLFDDVQSFIDERYIEELLDEEYRGDSRDRRRILEASVYLGDEAPTSCSQLFRAVDVMLEATDR